MTELTSGKKCIKCGYVRQPEEFAPDYECPKCGVIYEKTEPNIDETAESTQDDSLDLETFLQDEAPPKQDKAESPEAAERKSRDQKSRDRKSRPRRPRPSKRATRNTVRSHRGSDSAHTFIGSLKHKIIRGCIGKHWPLRAVLLLYLIYIGFRYLGDSTYTALFDPLNLIIHEGGHLLFSYFGMFIGFAGGTMLQTIVPIGSAIGFVRQGDYFAISVCGVWLATNLFGIATYMADARDRVLPLVTVGGGDPMHDWYYMLPKLGLLRHEKTIASIVRFEAHIVLWGSIALGVWMLWIMATRKEEISPQDY